MLSRHHNKLWGSRGFTGADDVVVLGGVWIEVCKSLCNKSGVMSDAIGIAGRELQLSSLQENAIWSLGLSWTWRMSMSSLSIVTKKII
jgi:hypothetical protein